MFFNNKFNTFFGLNLTLVYTFPMCMTWRFHFPLRNYDFNIIVSGHRREVNIIVSGRRREVNIIVCGHRREVNVMVSSRRQEVKCVRS